LTAPLVAQRLDVVEQGRLPRATREVLAELERSRRCSVDPSSAVNNVDAVQGLRATPVPTSAGPATCDASPTKKRINGTMFGELAIARGDPVDADFEPPAAGSCPRQSPSPDGCQRVGVATATQNCRVGVSTSMNGSGIAMSGFAAWARMASNV